MGIAHVILLNFLDRVLHLLVFAHDLGELLLKTFLFHLAAILLVRLLCVLLPLYLSALLLHDLHSALDVEILSLQVGV